jgi:hypothetical protein
MELGRLNCAGVGCGERDNCRRYRIRLPRLGEAEKLFDWASFDIEKVLFGDCPAVIKYRES